MVYVEDSELAAKDVFTMSALSQIQIADENIIRLQMVANMAPTGPIVQLTISGNQLLSNIEGGYIFDIDFDNQHRKFFEKSSGTYLMQLPNVIEQATPERYAVVRVTNVLETSGALSVAILINTNNEPWSGDAELSDIDVAAFFDDNIDLPSVEDIIKAVLKMEYDIPSGVTFNVVTTAEQSVSVDGGLWNLFTDGSVYVPLMLTSRLPDGSPLKVNEDSEDPAIETPKMVCSFNRPTTYAELLLHDFEAVTTDLFGAFAEKVPFIRYNENQYCFGNNEEGGAWVELRNNGTELWSILVGCIWNINLDNQFKRQLRIVDEGGSEDWTFRRILTPDYISDSPYQFVLGFKTDVDSDYIYIPINGSGEIRVFDPRTNSYVYRQSEIQVGNLVSIVADMYRMEFKMLYGGAFAELDDMPEDLPNGTFDMFTDSEVIV